MVQANESGFMSIRGNYTKTDWIEFGERNEVNKLHGRGIRFWGGEIYIGFWKNGVAAPGNEIHIRRYGNFHVGERYIKYGLSDFRGTDYFTDGRSRK